MARPAVESQSPARRNAENQFERRDRLDEEIRTYQQKRWDFETAKIARLKSLRLARDAAILNGPQAENRAKRRTRKVANKTAGE
jgi:hypothetical protein